MNGWTKLFGSIVTSSLWVEPDSTVRVWVAMLATTDADGIVEGSVPGFANLARVSVDQMRAAVATLSSPDPDSRTPDHEGRRIESIEGGWRILNYRAYRDRGQDKDGSKAPAMRAYRARLRRGSNASPQPVITGNALPEKVTGEPEERGERQEERRENQEPPSASASHSAEEVRKLWNDTIAPSIPRCLQLTASRRRAAEARVRERGLDGLREVFAAINASTFLCGENDRGWRPDFSWAMKPENVLKILEGHYRGGRTGLVAGATHGVPQAAGPGIASADATRRYLEAMDA